MELYELTINNTSTAFINLIKVGLFQYINLPTFDFNTFLSIIINYVLYTLPV